MSLIKKLELMQQEENKSKSSHGALMITTGMDSLTKLAESTSVTLSRNAVSARANEIISDISEKMRKTIYITFIFDESGSMDGVEEDMAIGFQQLVDQHRNDNIIVTTVLFNTNKRIIHKDVPIKNVSNLIINPNRRTRLYDTAIETLEDFDLNHPDVTDNAIFVMATDGEDNESSYDAKDRLRAIVKSGIAKGRKFYFLGDSIDAIKTANDIGINSDNAVQFSKYDHGFIVNFLAINNIIKDVQTKGYVSRDWKKPVEEHYLAIEQKQKKYELRF